MAEILALSRGTLRRLLMRPRFWISLLLAFGCVFAAFYHVPVYLSEHGYRLQAAEPYLILLPSRSAQILLMISFLLLVGDVPFLAPGLEMTALRSTRRKWLAGQLLAALGAAALWLLFLLACTLFVFYRGYISFQNEWSLFLKGVARSSLLLQDSVGLGLIGEIRMELIAGSTPYARLGWMLLFQLLLFWALTLWSLALNLWTRRSYGCLLTVSFWALRRFVQAAETIFQKDLSPLSPMDLVDLGKVRLTPARTVYIVLFFLIQICVLWILSAVKLKRADLSSSG